MNDKRQLACAGLCKGKKAVDVGTDHGHLAAYLITSGICESCIACDVNKKPLSSAAETVRRQGLEDRVKLVLSDGLDEIKPDGITDIVIAGMGGELIADILSRAEWVKTNKVNIVLQPMTKWDYLRKWLYDNGFEVTKEIPCEDGRFVYSVMQAVYIGKKPEYQCDTAYLYVGRVSVDSEDGRKYYLRQAQRLEAAGNGMTRSEDKASIGEEYIKTARSLREIAIKCDKGDNMTTVNDIYGYIDELAPYSLQLDFDNSGMNVVFQGKEIKKALIALDITNEIISEAIRENAQLIITHHPVIFRGLKTLDDRCAAVKLCSAGICAISAHTNFDSAKMNTILCKKLGLEPKEPLAVENQTPVGFVCDCEETTPTELAKRVKTALGNTVVRYNNFEDGKVIKRITVCSGSGGSYLNEALSKKADCLITGDVKHDVFIDAHNAGICVIDGGHYHTENIFCEYMLGVLSEKFKDVEFKIAASNADILSYEI